MLVDANGNLTMIGDVRGANISTASSTNWDYVFQNANASSGAWNLLYNTTYASSGSWNWAYNTVNASSSGWNQAAYKVNASSTNWDYTYGVAYSSSSNWNVLYNKTYSSSTAWDQTAYVVNASSTKWDKAYGWGNWNSNVAWVVNGTSIYASSTYTGVGIGTTTPSNLLTVYGTSTVMNAFFGVGTTTPGALISARGYESSPLLALNASTSASVLYINSAGRIGIGTSSPRYVLDVYNTDSSTNTVARLGRFNTDTVLIGGGAGKITAGTFDPLFDIGGNKYATYLSGMSGVKEETTGVVYLNEAVCRVEGKNGCLKYIYKHAIDFDLVAEASDDWLFYEVTDFGENWSNLAVLVSPEGQGQAWYEKDPANNQIIFYGSLPASISYRLTSPRFDWKKWSNISESGDAVGLKPEETVNDRYSSSTIIVVNPATSSAEQSQGVVDDFLERLNVFVSAVEDEASGLSKMVVDGILEVRNDVITQGFFKTILSVAKTTLEERVAFIGNLPWASESQLESSSEDAENASFVTYNIVSSRKEIMVSGSAQLLMDEQGLEARINFHPSFSSFIADPASIKVVLTPTSYVNGSLYVSEKSIYGFTVRQANGQDVGTGFDWLVVAKLTDPSRAQQALDQTQTIVVQQMPTGADSGSTVQESSPGISTESIGTETGTTTESIAAETEASTTESSASSSAVLIQENSSPQESSTTEQTLSEPEKQPVSSASLSETAE